MSKDPRPALLFLLAVVAVGLGWIALRSSDDLQEADAETEALELRKQATRDEIAELERELQLLADDLDLGDGIKPGEIDLRILEVARAATRRASSWDPAKHSGDGVIDVELLALLEQRRMLEEARERLGRKAEVPEGKPGMPE